MAVAAANILEQIDQEDKEKVSYFIRLLLNKSKYQQLKREIADRRKEVQSGEAVSHENLWKQMNV